MTEAERALKKYFGYPSFRPGQSEIIDSILAKQDTLAIMPTGGGKSICFQIPGLLLPGITLVISPLISLMADQVQQLEKRRIPAVFINSSLSKTQIKTRLEHIRQKKYQFVYAAPERLLTSRWLKLCADINVSLIAIDEAHCASMWGHDFRPSYQLIPKFVDQLKTRPTVAAFTATATPQVKQDMLQMLKLKSPQVFWGDTLRTNLFLKNFICHSSAQKEAVLFKILKQHQDQAGIIYCSTRKQCQRLAGLINRLNFNQVLAATPCRFYHGGMDTAARQDIQEQFISNQTKLICATNAFGMGVDKPDIRFVVHYQLPANLENFYQEVGRAGRDRQPSDCYLLFYQPDTAIQQGLIQNNQDVPDNDKQADQYLQLKLKKLKSLVAYAVCPGCLQQKISKYFGQEPAAACGECSQCQPVKFTLTLSEQAWFDQLQTIPNLTLQTKYLAAILQPQTQQQWLKLPGIGTGLKNSFNQLNHYL